MLKLFAFAAVAALLLGIAPANAQTSDTRFTVVGTCGSPTAGYAVGAQAPPTMDTTGTACTSNAGASSAVSPSASAAGGATPFHKLSAANTNPTSIKAAAAGTLYSIVATNTGTAVYYLKFYDTAGAPTCNSDPVVQTIALPFAGTNAGYTVAISFPVGMLFANGIGMCLTGAAADNDNTNAATGVTISVTYK